MKLSTLKTLVLGLLLSVFCTQAFAVETLTLEQMREEVLDDNIDVKIQYEKYYQAQQNVRVKLGEFLPNLNFQLVFWNTPFALLYSLTPTPSSWFVYQSSQEAAIAEKYISESIKLNILKDLTLTYLNILHQERLMESMLKQEESLVNAYDRARNLEALGFGSDSDTFTAHRTLLQHQNDIFALNAVIAAHKESLYLSLNRMPGTEIDLVDFAPTEEDIPVSVDDAVSLAYDNSPELKANQFIQEAARYMVKSAKWSFVSFSGIGFGYPATLRLERSKLREVILEGEKLENQIANQIDLAYIKLNNVKMRIDTQNQILMTAQIEYDRVAERYEVGQATLQELILAQSTVLSEERKLLSLEMQKNVEIVNIKRLLGLDATDNDVIIDVLDQVAIMSNVYTSSFGRKRVVVDLDMPESLKDEVVSVVYGGDVFDYRLLNTTGNFSLSRKFRDVGTKSITAQILFKSGQVLKLETSVDL